VLQQVAPTSIGSRSIARVRSYRKIPTRLLVRQAIVDLTTREGHGPASVRRMVPREFTRTRSLRSHTALQQARRIGLVLDERLLS
jgi:hypothetical protein